MFNSYRDKYNNFGQTAWDSFNKEVNGTFEKHKHSLFGRITYRHGLWAVVLDTFPKTSFSFFPSIGITPDYENYTRILAPYSNKEGIVAEIYEKTFVSTIGRLFGMQDIDIGAPYFDDMYIVKSNNQELMKKMLIRDKIRDLIFNFNGIHLKINSTERVLGDLHPEAKNEVYMETNEAITDLAKLKLFDELFGLVLTEIQHFSPTKSN